MTLSPNSTAYSVLICSKACIIKKHILWISRLHRILYRQPVEYHRLAVSTHRESRSPELVSNEKKQQVKTKKVISPPSSRRHVMRLVSRLAAGRITPAWNHRAPDIDLNGLTETFDRHVPRAPVWDHAVLNTRAFRERFIGYAPC